MKQFFNEYGGVAIIVIVIAVLLLLVGSVKSLDETTGKVNGSGVASMVGNKFSESINKFQKSFMAVDAAKGPNGEPVISKDESQVGKYADVDGDGTVDGIIFADLMVGGSGTWNDYDTSVSWANAQGSYTIPTVTSTKDYYVSQESYTNKLGETAEVLSPTGSGNDRFYIMALSGIDSNRHDWYHNAVSGKMSDYASTTNQDFGKGKSNTATMISKWNSKAYGDQNTCSIHTDLWGEIQTQVNNGWFVPSRQELAAFAGQLGITKSNYSSKGLSDWCWSSSQYGANSAYIANFSDVHIYGIPVDNGTYVRLAATF